MGFLVSCRGCVSVLALFLELSASGFVVLLLSVIIVGLLLVLVLALLVIALFAFRGIFSLHPSPAARYGLFFAHIR